MRYGIQESEFVWIDQQQGMWSWSLVGGRGVVSESIGVFPTLDRACEDVRAFLARVGYPLMWCHPVTLAS